MIVGLILAVLTGLVWNLADITMGAMASVNIIAIFLLGGIVMKALKDYEIQRKNGKRPVFKGEKKRTRTCGMRISYVKNSMMLCFGQ